MSSHSFLKRAWAGAIIGLLSTTANATLFTGSSGNLAASVDFSISGSTLTVVLTNTSSADVLVPSDVLTAVFFDISGNPTLTSASALLTSGSSVFYAASQPAGGVVGGEWGYGTASSSPSGAGSLGISSSGLGGAFGQPTFPGSNLAGPVALDGLQYGLLSAGDNSATGNTGVTGSGGLIKNSVTFTLTGISANATFSNVYFQYGTALTEPGYTGNCVSGNCVPPTSGNPVPEPATTWLLGASLLGFYGFRRKLAISRL